MTVIALHQLSKNYDSGKIKAVNQVSFQVQKGELFGLIGPDGAGKTSIFRMLTTLLLPDGGTATVGGLDIVNDYQQIRKKIGYMPGKFSLYKDLSVEENLHFFATLFGTSIHENYDIIKDIYSQLLPFKDRKADQLSGGMKQKLALCCALIHYPDILFLDEPTTGVDVVSRKEFWHILKTIQGQGITTLVSTPYMDEASLCDRIALMQSGEILSINTPEAIIQAFPYPLYAIKASRMSQLLTDLRNINLVKTCNTFGNYHHITLQQDSPKSKEELLHILAQKGNKEVEMMPIEPTIEDCFIDLMKKND